MVETGNYSEELSRAEKAQNSHHIWYNEPAIVWRRPDKSETKTRQCGLVSLEKQKNRDERHLMIERIPVKWINTRLSLSMTRKRL